MSRHGSTDVRDKLTGIGEPSTLIEDHLRLPGLPEQFPSLTYAHLVVEGKHLPVHTGVLALVSPVFTELFMTAADDRAAAALANQADSLCVPMTGHTLHDTCATLKFVYQRSMLSPTETPSEQLWMSKFDMKSILKECDSCLSEKAQEAGGHGVHMFNDDEDVMAWAALAEGCDVGDLLATAETHMVEKLYPTFWQSKSFAAHKLSQACFLRLLHGAQYHAIYSARIHTAPNAAKSLPERFFAALRQL